MSNSTITTHITTSNIHHHHHHNPHHHHHHNPHHHHHHHHPNHHHHHHHHRISNGTQACAACKYQRRKCAQDCALAPYFPHDRQPQFLNAHKLYGVSNIIKIIRNLNHPDKDIAMRTIIYQSDVRAKDPVGGCYRIIQELEHQIAYSKAELDLVLQQLELCKAQVYQHQLMQVDVGGASASNAGDHNNNNNNDNNNNQGNEIVACNDDNNNNNNDDDSYQQYQALMRCYYYDGVDQVGNNNNNQEQYMVNGISQQNELDLNDQNSWVNPAANEDAVLASSNSSTSHGNCFVIKNEIGGECEGLDMKQEIQINLNGGDTSYDDDREYASKFDNYSTHLDLSCCDLREDELKFDPQQTELSEEVLKQEKIVLDEPVDETFHHISEHDLRNAATLFTLTS